MKDFAPRLGNQHTVSPFDNAVKVGEAIMHGATASSLGLLLATAASAILTSSLSAQPANEAALEELRAQRRELAHRPRRIIANNDGCDALYFPRDLEATVDNFLDRRTTALAGSQVDTIAYCTISSGFSNFTHRTEAGTILRHSPADFGIQPDMRNITSDLIDLGTDPLQAVLEFGHGEGIEVFWSMRMNDTHDVAHTPENPYFLFPPLKVERPELLVSDHVKRTPKGRWSSVNYALPEVRDLALAYIEEVCTGYDIDGIELDFFRHMCYFPSVANGGQATQEERDMMTDLLGRVRAMTEEVGLQRGRPILVAVRVADSVEFDRDMGLDIERWLADGLVDILVTTCYFRLNPWEYSVELGHRYDVPVYPCLSDSRVQGESRFRRSSVESYRGRGMNVWAAGADGIHLFNFFDADSPVFREIGDPEGLAGLDKLYFPTVRDGNPESWLAGATAYRTVPLLTPSHALGVPPGEPLAIDIAVGEDFDAAAKPEVTLHLEMPGVARAEQVDVTINGHPLAAPTLTEGWLDYAVRPELLERGANRVEITLDPAELPVAGDWTIAYEAGELPTAPWFRDAGSERTEETLTAEGLFIADRGTVAGDYQYYRYAWGADPGEPIVIEAEVKVVAGSSFIILDNGRSHQRIGLWPDHLDLWTDRDARYDMDTTDGFHTYRIETDGPGLKVYVDGELRLDAPAGFRPGNSSQNQFAFGAANSPMEGEAYWRQVRAHVAGQGLRDLAISVNYP